MSERTLLLAAIHDLEEAGENALCRITRMEQYPSYLLHDDEHTKHRQQLAEAAEKLRDAAHNYREILSRLAREEVDQQRELFILIDLAQRDGLSAVIRHIERILKGRAKKAPPNSSGLPDGDSLQHKEDPI